jgi:hypothetical protein
MMFVNIITPCSRPNNLNKIAQSINMPRENYRWIVVFDNDVVLDAPNNCESYAIKVAESTSGNAQRNYAINLVKEGWVYFNDDDTIIHPDLWKNIKDVNADIIHFIQNLKDGTLRLLGNNVKLNEIDSHNFLVKNDIIGNERWILNRYEADGIFAEKCYKKASTKLYIPKVLSIYNCLK